MTAARNSAILFGASGNIGSALLGHMKQEGWSTLGTYANRPQPDMIPCDLTEADAVKDVDLGNYRYGIILSAICNIDQCKRDPVLARTINLEGTKRLLATLAEGGVRPVFFSSDYVYDGAKGIYSEADPPSPNTEYGRHKAEMEAYIQENHPEGLIVRISKVLSTDPYDNTLFSQWYRMVQRNETIRSISDHRICSTYLGDITAGLLELLNRDARGLFNVCQPKGYTRGELLAEFLRGLDISYEKTVEMKAREFGFLDNRPGDICLDPKKFVEFTGYQFTSMKEVFRRFQRNLETR